ncbi:transcription factor Ouib-like isoform X2 [Episyrphus balteatus]|uniref:transcription factor Ouib-like isoform X2 n=1 Tax=Episyrphus balteatus TaxID=286459 RepID=UPI0024860597|nr:transcription factor Ouib-like isoform X2 [Episyrphus balteatus]
MSIFNFNFLFLIYYYIYIKMDQFDTTCRTCNAIRLNLVNLYSDSLGNNDAIKLYDALCSVCPWLSIQNNDKLPQKICFFCSKQLEIAYKFQQQCKKSDKELWQVVNDSVKEESSQVESVENDDEESSEDEQIENCDEIFCQEEDGEDVTTIEGSPEFLEDDDDDENMETSPQPSPVRVDETPAPDEDSSKTPFDCKHCDKKYLTSNGLLLHMKLAHKNLNPTPIETFPCKYCDKVFDSHDDRKDHYHLEHKNDSKSEVTCHICQKSFIGKNKLDHHLLYHEKNQFKCLVKDCKRTFLIKYKLTDHLKRFHGIVLNIKQSKALKANSNTWESKTSNSLLSIDAI